MKKLLICAGAFLLTAAMAMGQKTKAKPAAKTNTATPSSNTVMKNLNDSFSYAAGMNIAVNMREQGITNINSALMIQAINDVFSNKTKALSAEKANACLQSQMGIYEEKKKAELSKKIAPEIAKGQAFLASNKIRPGVVTLPDGLQYEIIKAGDPAGVKPTVRDTVVVNYAGKLIDGTEFDSSTKNGGPVTFPVGNVIRGWVEILQLMTKGAHWKVYIPHELAYGTQGNGPVIPPGAALIFDMTLEDILAAPSK
ncbi:MAG: FKBP-type peptidyl-prolyl cis-trans isomerase [Ferruginibacter sp.]